MARTIQEVFDSHVEAIETIDFQKLAGDYAEDAVLITLDGSFHGRDEIMSDFFQASLSQFPDVKFTFEKTTIEGDTCLLKWSADASAVKIPAGPCSPA